MTPGYFVKLIRMYLTSGTWRNNEMITNRMGIYGIFYNVLGL